MAEWNVEDVGGDVRVTHWHRDENRHTTSVETDPTGRLRAECDDCHAVVVMSRDAERRLIADDTANDLAYETRGETPPDERARIE